MAHQKNITLGIIGYGKFAQLTEEVILRHKLLEGRGLNINITLRFYSRSNSIDRDKFFAIEDIAECDYIVPTVPIRYFEKTISQLAQLLKNRTTRETTVIDVCSVKIHPKKIMQKYLGDMPHVNTIATHPNFGPESFRLNSYKLAGLNFICENVGCKPKLYKSFVDLLTDLGLKLEEIDADTHDRTIGVAHFTSMFIGQIVSDLEIEKPQFAAASTIKMFEMIDGVGKDLQILQDMYQFNPYCKEFAGLIAANTTKTLTQLSE